MSLFLILIINTIIILLIIMIIITFRHIIEILGDNNLTKSETFVIRMKVLLLRPLPSYDNINITAGVAVLLTILTMLSTPILTAIFGDGSLEVCGHSPRTKVKLFTLKHKVFQTCFQSGGGHRGLGLRRGRRNRGKTTNYKLQIFEFWIPSPGGEQLRDSWGNKPLGMKLFFSEWEQNGEEVTFFKQGLVQQADDEEVETRVATNEFAQLEQLAQDLDNETKVNKSKRKSKKWNQVGGEMRTTNPHITSLGYKCWGCWRPPGRGWGLKDEGELSVLEDIFFSIPKLSKVRIHANLNLTCFQVQTIYKQKLFKDVQSSLWSKSEKEFRKSVQQNQPVNWKWKRLCQQNQHQIIPRSGHLKTSKKITPLPTSLSLLCYSFSFTARNPNPCKKDMLLLKFLIIFFLMFDTYTHSFSFSKDYTAQHPTPCQKDMLMLYFLINLFSYVPHIKPTVTSSSKTIPCFSYEARLLCFCFIVFNAYFDWK